MEVIDQNETSIEKGNGKRMPNAFEAPLKRYLQYIQIEAIYEMHPISSDTCVKKCDPYFIGTGLK